MSRRTRTLQSVLVAGSLVLGGAGGARAQLPDPPNPNTTVPPTTTSTTDPPITTTTIDPPPESTTTPPTPTTSPAPDDTAPTTSTTGAPSTTTTTRPGATPPTTSPGSAPVAPPPADGGDGAAPPGAIAQTLPPDLLALSNSVRRSGSNGTAKLIDALAPLVAMGMSEQEAVQAGFGRFPVGGRATFTDDWWFPRFVPLPHLHEGTDIFAAYGTPARAPATGTLRLNFSAVGGLSAYVTEADGTYYYLAHLSRFEPGQVTGQAVNAGDIIGYVGDSGNARGTPPHVHFEVHPAGGGPTNPKPYLDAWLQEALDAVPVVVAAAAPNLAQRAQTTTEEQELTAVGHTDLGGRSGYGDVAVVGRTAVVAAGDDAPRPTDVSASGPDGTTPPPGALNCAATVSVVNIADPTMPAVAATITLPPGRRVEDLDALAVRTPAFSGDVAAVVLGPCTPGDGGTSLAFYDVTNPTAPELVGRVPHPRRLADPADRTDCGPVLRGTCTRTDRTVDLQQRPDGRVVSLSSTAGTTGTAPEVFVVDLTDLEAPRSLGFVALAGRDPAGVVDDGCSPIRLPSSATAGDGGRTGSLIDFGLRFAPRPRSSDGLDLDGATDLPAVADAGGGRRLAIAAEGTWWSSNWGLRVEPQAGAASADTPGCSGPLSGAIPDAAGQGAGAGPTAGELVYVGRGCPARRDVDGGAVEADPYLSDPAGRIAVSDAALAPAQQGLADLGCTAASKLARARQADALGLVVAGSFLADPGDATDAPAGVGPDGGDSAVATATPGAAGTIPAFQLRKPDGDALRDRLCQQAPVAGTGCTPGVAPVSGEVVELGGRWGGLRVLDVTNPEAPRQVEVYRTANAAASTPAEPDASYAVEAAVADGSRVYAAWGSDGLRILDLASGSPVEVASFVPPQPGIDPGPAQITGVASTADHIVVTDRATGLWVLDKRPPADTRGYWLADVAGGVHGFGDAAVFGSADGLGLTSPVVGMAPTPTAHGYWLATAEGGVYAFGDALFAGSLAGAGTAPVVGVASTPSGRGYWLVSADGGVYAFGDASFLGSLSASPPAKPVVALLPTPSGRGYRLVAADGGVFAFGDADYLGSTAASPPGAPVVGATTTGSGRGYWLVAADGGVFAFGDARFKGAVSGLPLPSPVVSVAAMTGVRGYWLAGADGGLYALGAPFLGARAAGARSPAVVAVAAVPRPPAPEPSPARTRETLPGLRPAS